MTTFFSRICCITASAAFLSVGTLRAQSLESSVALGVAVPNGGLGKNRTAGPVLRGAVTFGDRQRRHVRLRLALESAWLLERGARPSTPTSNNGTFRSLSALASIVVGARGTPAIAPYFLAGLGVERLAVVNVTNPYGATLGFRAGVGMQWRVGSHTMFAEITPHLAATDFGTGTDFGTASYVPIVLGIRF
jgi:hypothetical protein